MQILIIILIIFGGNVGLFAQDNLPTVPTAIYIGNAAFQAPVLGAKIALVLQEDFDNQRRPISKFIGEFFSDTAGIVTVSLVPDKHYLITASKDGYYTQLLKIETTNFSRTKKNKKGLSLRPQNVISIKGNVDIPEGTKGTITITSTSTQHSRVENLATDGSYDIKVVKDDTYQLSIYVKDMIDTTVSIGQKELESSSANTPFVYNFVPNKPQPNYRAGDIFVLETYNLKFIDRSHRLSSEIWLDTLARVLKDNPDVKMEIQIFTDSRKSDRLNYLLAKKRSELVADELAERAVLPSQYSFELKGEDEILNHCLDGVDCSREEHAINNRLVLLITEGAFVFKE